MRITAWRRLTASSRCTSKAMVDFRIAAEGDFLQAGKIELVDLVDLGIR